MYLPSCHANGNEILIWKKKQQQHERIQSWTYHFDKSISFFGSLFSYYNVVVRWLLLLFWCRVFVIGIIELNWLIRIFLVCVLNESEYFPWIELKWANVNIMSAHDTHNHSMPECITHIILYSRCVTKKNTSIYLYPMVYCLYVDSLMLLLLLLLLFIFSSCIVRGFLNNSILLNEFD